MAMLLLLCAGLMTHIVSGQGMSPPAIEWQLDFGGTNSDVLTALQQTADGGYIFGGYSFSPVSGNKTSPNYGGSDFWIVRVDANINTLWQRSFGGETNDHLFALEQTSDGGYVLGGYSASPPSGNKTSPHYGGRDFWVIRLDANGEKLWERSFGGSGDDDLFSLQRTSDGGFIIGGRSSSNTNVTKSGVNWGGYDFWVVRLDGNGERLWDRTYGGSANDVLKAVRETAGGGGFILGGYSESPADGTKTTSKFAKFADAWLVRIGGDGQQLWDHSYWSSRVPQEYYAETFVEALEQAENGDFVFGGTVAAAIAQFPSAFWVARTDENGNELWDWDLGFVYGYALQTLKMAGDSGVLIGGKDPVRVARLDAEGMLLWERVFSLDAGFELRSIQQTRDGGCIIGVRSTTGVAYEKTAPNYGASDYWIVKFAADAPRLRAIAPLAGSNVLGLELFPGTTNHSYRIDCSTNLENWTALQTNRTATYKIEITNTNRSLRFYRAERLPE